MLNFLFILPSRAARIQTVSRGGYWLIPPRVEVPPPSNGPDGSAPVSPAAFQECLKARYCYEQGSHVSVVPAIGYFEKAVASNPRFARAYAGLADCYNFMARAGFENPDDCYRRSKAAAMTALDLDDDAPEPHASLALARMCQGLEWGTAEAGFRKAISLNPDYPCGHNWLALCLLARGRIAEAIREAETARSLDPVSIVFAGMLVRCLFAARAFQEAENVCLDMLELRPTYPALEWLLDECYWHQGRAEQARQRLEYMREIAGLNPTKAAVSLAVFSGQPDKAIEMLVRLGGAVERAASIWWARVCAWVGDPPGAFRWLDCAFQHKDTGVLLVDVDPSFTHLRSEPRFETLLRNLRLRPASPLTPARSHTA
ncbi:MAG: tetratricopeptide repeat protein [Acidobacteria bacterium]|nr:MAG: tetratricopeptide repeat protein [Acidobacteriota bacterium]